MTESDARSADGAKWERWVVVAALIVGVALRVAILRAPGVAIGAEPSRGASGWLFLAVDVVLVIVTAMIVRSFAGTTAAAFALVLGSLDPVQVAGPEGVASLGVLALVVCCCRTIELRIWSGLLVGAAVAIRVFVGVPTPKVSEPWRLAWSDSPVVGEWLAGLNHFGWVALLLAASGALRSSARVRLLVAIALAVTPFMRIVSSGLMATSAVAPPLVACAALTLAALSERSRFSAYVVLLLVVLTNAPTLVSDARAGLRFPVRAVLDRLAPDEQAHVTSTVPDLFRDTGTVADDLVEANLSGLVVLPVMNERLIGGPQSLLEKVEALAAPAFEVRVARFDLYRPELRVFRIGAPTKR